MHESKILTLIKRTRCQRNYSALTIHCSFRNTLNFSPNHDFDTRKKEMLSLVVGEEKICYYTNPIDPDFVMGLASVMRLRWINVGYNPALLSRLAPTMHSLLPGPPWADGMIPINFRGIGSATTFPRADVGGALNQNMPEKCLAHTKK